MYFLDRTIQEFRERLASTAGVKPDAAAPPPAREWAKVPDQAFNTLYAAALDQMYKSRDAYMATAQAAQNMMFLFYSAAGAMFLLALRSEYAAALPFLVVVCGLCTGFPYFFRGYWQDKLSAGYNLYVAACVHAFVVARAMDVPLAHSWLVLVDTYRRMSGYFVYPAPPGQAIAAANRAVELGAGVAVCEFREERPGNAQDPCRAAATHQELIAVWKQRPRNLYIHYSWVCCKFPAFVFAAVCVLVLIYYAILLVTFLVAVTNP